MKILSQYYPKLVMVILLSASLIIQSSCKKATETPAPVDTPGANVFMQDNFNIASTCTELFISAKADVQGKGFLYVAAKEGGLKIFPLTGGTVPVANIAITELGSLHVMNLSQSGNYLFLALGNHFGSAQQSPGMAIVDITDPLHPVLKSLWQDNSKSGGTGIVEISGNYAYLGAMGNGLIIFDISDKTAPVVKSVFVPSINYPDNNPDPKKFNARGMTILGDIIYLCYDAGGLRLLNVADKVHPAEIGRYSNPEMNGKPRAYNNIVVDGNYAYLAVDYCGMEVLDISQPANIKLVSWWNPWNCQSDPMNWFNSNGHCNEIVLDKTNHLVFLSSGKSDLQVVNIADPTKPVYKGEYGGINNNIGTWGVSISGNNIYLTYICSFIPFYSNWTGVKAITFSVH